MTRASLATAPFLLWALLAAAAPARAACTISATPLSFGNYNVFNAAPLDSTGTITIRCQPTANVRVTLSRGGSLTYLPRQLTGPGGTLNYNIFTTAARTTIWGDETEGTAAYYGRQNPGLTPLTCYGRVPALQDAAAGNYSDTIVATINF